MLAGVGHVGGVNPFVASCCRRVWCRAWLRRRSHVFVSPRSLTREFHMAWGVLSYPRSVLFFPDILFRYVALVCVCRRLIWIKCLGSDGDCSACCGRVGPVSALLVVDQSVFVVTNGGVDQGMNMILSVLGWHVAACTKQNRRNHCSRMAATWRTESRTRLASLATSRHTLSRTS